MKYLLALTLFLAFGCMQTDFWFEGDCLKKEISGGIYRYGKVGKTISFIEVEVHWEDGTITKEGGNKSVGLLKEISCE